MPQWFLKQWRDIKGNVKWDVVKWAVLGLVAVAISSFSLLKHGLSPWQQVALFACFGLTLVWALIATWAAITLTQPTLDSTQKSERGSPDVPPPPPSVLSAGSAIDEQPYLMRATAV
jgi:protein-S-isoprenylcysteine O-methyltransferase Ste14